MRHLNTWVAAAVAAVLVALLTQAARAEVKVVVNHNANGETNADFKFNQVPAPSTADAATHARFTIVDGEADPNGGGIEKLNDGKVPTEEDQPAENFFFNAGTEGGRIGVELEKAIDIKQVNTYSWHPNTRGPQFYKLYASDGTGEGFNSSPKKGTDPEKAGWKLIASVDTRPKEGDMGGQYGVSISDSQGALGKFKYLLFDCSRTESDDEFGNTFYGEIDVIDQNAAGGSEKPAPTADAGTLGDSNKLTDAEVKQGWKLLFDGKSLDGWHSFHRDNVRPGWKVQDGTLACVDPHNAGDLCTNDKYDWFELQLDYNITHAGNSGIMYHVTDKGGAVWATGPEFQLEDNTAAADPIRCGWLYALYQPPVDPATGKTLDATKPVGEWNHVRLLMTPEKCVHEINGVKYFEYVLNSDDFKQRVAKSKFASMPDFAKSDIGYIALQGDHGAISFRDIKVRPIESKPKE